VLVVNLVGVTMLREMGPLLAAIIVAGRTGSAYTAEIGTMRITEELDALRSLGITPLEMLVVPKLLGLLIALPLLTLYASALGIFGGMVVADSLYNVGYADFLRRLPDAFAPSTFWVGLIKAPVFALLVAAVACHRGFQVTHSAESIGRETTVSVVQSIFLVIIADAVFSVLFQVFGL
jgi:phospholipid/cholesterol/gamma-HCH transport system permease protein